MLVLVGTLVALTGQKPTESVTYDQIVGFYKDGKVRQMLIDGYDLYIKLDDGNEYSYELPSIAVFLNDVGDEIAVLRDEQKVLTQDYKVEKVSWWISLIPYAFLIIVFVIFWAVVMNRQDGGAKSVMNFGRSHARMATGEENKVTFKEVAGADEEKRDLEEIVEFLKDPKRFLELGARIPKGVLLVGPPGTGKTLIAKAVAGEAGVPFFSISGSDFVELYVGVGASRVRDLFANAKKAAPSIVFIDEIDAVGRRRGAGLGGGHDEREQTLNQLLVEMDGFGNNAGVIVLAATNRADILDPALLRPGRFDRRVYIGVPDIKGREAILKIHARKKPFEDDVSFESIARSTVGFTGADLENLLNEAALLTARKGKKKIGNKDIDEAFIKIIMGNEKKNRVISEREKRLTAFHEAGHALTAKLLPTQDPVQQISIVPRGRAGGFTLNMPKEDKYTASRNEMLDELVVLLGGRAAEKLMMDDISTGASNDIERASELARKMVTKYGMSDKIGPISFGNEHDEVFLGRDFTTTKTVSEGTASVIDGEIKHMIDAAFERSIKLLSENEEVLTRVAEYLMQNETMDAEQFEAVFKGETPPERKNEEEAPAPELSNEGEKPEEPSDKNPLPDEEPGEKNF
ncbi:MAG: ATP-dependent zinc metalloprotease FtsH [Clostridia bacterium]|nr:ATP-dependent zinc metalloprotease FtsH [Clostridia bacterium]